MAWPCNTVRLSPWGMRQWIKQCQGAKPGGRSNGSHVRSLYNTASRSQPAIRVQASGDRSIPELSLPTSACYSRAPRTPGAESRTKFAVWASGGGQMRHHFRAGAVPAGGVSRGRRCQACLARTLGLLGKACQASLASTGSECARVTASATARAPHPASLRSWRSTGVGTQPQFAGESVPSKLGTYGKRMRSRYSFCKRSIAASSVASFLAKHRRARRWPCGAVS